MRIAALLLVAPLVSACGSQPGSIPASTTIEPDATVSMFEWGFGPGTLSVRAGSAVVIRIRNDGGILHEWAVLTSMIEAEADYSRDDVIASASVEPGAVSWLEFVAPGPGTYQIICPIPGHLSQGMEGTLVATP